MAREFGTSVETSATPEQVWRVWSDMSTWGDWNPNVSTMSWNGGFVADSKGVMNTRAGQHHQMQLVDVVPGKSFALLTAVVPGTRFRFNCRILPGAAGASARTRVEQTVEVGGPLGPVLGGMLGPQVSKEFGTLLENLARTAEKA